MTKSWSILRDHIYYNMCDEDDTKFNWFMTWMAHIVQKPDEKYGMAVVVTGAEVSGKSTVFDYLYAILPTGHFHYSSIRGFSSKFNSELKNNRLVMFEDSMDNFTKDAAFIKRLVTEDTLYIESKGADVIEIPNYLRLVLLTQSNEIKVPCERRFVQLKMSTKPEYAQYFEHIWCQMQGGGSEVFKEELENWVPPQADGWGCLRRKPYSSITTVQDVNDYIHSINGDASQDSLDERYEKEVEFLAKHSALILNVGRETRTTTLPEVKWGKPSIKASKGVEFLKKLRGDHLADDDHPQYPLPTTYGPDNWTAEELIHCVDSNGTVYLAEQNNWNESDVMGWYEEATAKRNDQ